MQDEHAANPIPPHCKVEHLMSVAHMKQGSMAQQSSLGTSVLPDPMLGSPVSPRAGESGLSNSYNGRVGHLGPPSCFLVPDLWWPWTLLKVEGLNISPSAELQCTDMGLGGSFLDLQITWGLYPDRYVAHGSLGPLSFQTIAQVVIRW